MKGSVPCGSVNARNLPHTWHIAGLLFMSSAFFLSWEYGCHLHVYPWGVRLWQGRLATPTPPPCSPCPVRLTLQSTISTPRVKIKPARWSHQNDGRSTLEAVKPKLCFCYFCYCHIRILHQDREENRKITSVSHGETHHLNTHELCAWPSMSWPPLWANSFLYQEVFY